MRSSLFSICLLLCHAACAHIKPFSFGITTTDDFIQKTTPITLTLYWHQSSYQCIIEASAPDHVYECETDDAKRTVVSDTMSMNRLHISSAEHISIQSIIIWDDNGNYHEINSFCAVNQNDACDDYAVLSSAVIQFPSTDILLRSPNELHQGFLRHIDHHQPSDSNESQRRRQMDTGTDIFDIDHFEFTLSDVPGSGIDEYAFQAVVFWREYKFACSYNDEWGVNKPVFPGETVVCNDSNALFLSENIPLDDSFKFELLYTGSHNDTMRIDSFRVYTVNGAYFEINEFCVPSVFNVSKHYNTITPCALFPHKYSLSNLPIDRPFLHRFYLQFRDEIHDRSTIASYANQAFAGNVRLLEPFEVEVTLNKSADFTINLGIDYALYWDEYIIKCENIETNACTFATATKNIECNHESHFMFRVHNRGGNGLQTDTIIIESIEVKDSITGYRVDNFCISNAFDAPQTGTQHGNCTHSAYSTVPKWTQACVGDASAPGACSDTSINIRFPHDFLIYNDIADIQHSSPLFEGLVENKDAHIPATCSPTKAPSTPPTIDPTNDPTAQPTINPTNDPTADPTADPTVVPTNYPTQAPTFDPTIDPTKSPTANPTYIPTKTPTIATYDPTVNPTLNPTLNPSMDPTDAPAIDTTAQQIITTEYGKEEHKLGGDVFDDALVWFNKNTANKIISGVALVAFVLICCLICYICSIKKCCCFKKSTNIDDKPLNASAASLKSNSDARSPDADRANSVQLVSVESPPTSSVRKVSSIVAPLHDEYIVQFKTKPFGMSWSTLKTDQYNLYVSKVEPNSIAAQNKIRVGHKLVALNGDSIEGIGSKKIYEQINAAGLPISIMFRKRSKRQRGLRSQTVPSQSGEGSSFDQEGSHVYDPLAPGTPVQSAQSPFIGISPQRLSQIQEAASMSPMNLSKNAVDGTKTLPVSQINLDELSSSGDSADLMYEPHGAADVAQATGVGGNTPIEPDILSKMSTVMMSAESEVLQHAVVHSGNVPSDDD